MSRSETKKARVRKGEILLLLNLAADPKQCDGVRNALRNLIDEMEDLRREIAAPTPGPATAELASALALLADAADSFAASQDKARDPRVGLVQPVTVEECVALNCALAHARDVLSRT
jgi:hypothetical protein